MRWRLGLIVFAAAGCALSHRLPEVDGVDAAPPASADASTTDARMPDAHAFDAHTPDANTPDANTPDTSVIVDAGALSLDPRQAAYIKASNPGEHDEFGSAVAISADGNTLAVGAYNESSAGRGIDSDQTDNSAQSAGAVYIFTRDGGVWSQQTYIKAAEPAQGDYFGWDVALSADGNTLAVAATGDSRSQPGAGAFDAMLPMSGAVYVFARRDGMWSQQAHLKASNAGARDQFGGGLALSADGNLLAVGAPYEDGRPAPNDDGQNNDNANDAGAVYVFARDGTSWSQSAYLKAAFPDAGDDFGDAVALSGDGRTLAVGAYHESSSATGVDGDAQDNSAQASGAVYLFTQANGRWTQAAYLKASNTERYDELGNSVSLTYDGNLLAVGARGESSGADRNQLDNSQYLAGAVYIFRRERGAWAQTAFLKSSHAGRFDWFGWLVSFSADGSLLAISAMQESGDERLYLQGSDAYAAGAIHLYARSATDWVPLSVIQAEPRHAHDLFGHGTALCADGTTLAAGARYEQGAGSGINPPHEPQTGLNTGALFVIDLNPSR